MENRMDVYGVGILEKGRQLVKHSSGILLKSGICLLGLLLSNAALPGGMAPFGVAFAAAAPASLLLPAALGAAIGYLLHFASGKIDAFVIQWGYLCGILLALGVNLAGHMLQNGRRRWNSGYREAAFRFLGSAFGVIAPALTVHLFTRLTVQDIVGLISEGVAALGACWMFTRLLRCIGSGLEKFSRADIGSVLMTAGLVVAALSRICIHELSVGRVLALLVVMLYVGCVNGEGHSGSGASIGVAAGAMVALCGAHKGFGYTLPGIWGLGGLMADIFAPMGSGVLCAALLLGETAAVYLFAQDARAYIILIEAMAASVIYLMFPAKLRSFLCIRTGIEAADKGGVVGELLLSRLRGTGEALSEIAKTTETVADKLMQRQNHSDGTPEQIFGETVQRVCRRCSDRARCWAGCYSETVDGFNRLGESLRKDSRLSVETISSFFSQGCIQPERLAFQAERDFQIYLEQKEKKRISGRVRGVVTDQFEGLSMVMEDMERQLRALRRCHAEQEKQLLNCCRRNHLDVRNISCFLDSEQHMTMELTLPTGQWYRLQNARRLSTAELTAQLGSVCQKRFAPPEAHSEEDQTKLTFFEQPKYTLQTGSAQLSAGGARICGDACSVFLDRERREILLISDGMGTGPRAAMDSAMTAGLLSRLLRAGIEPEAALKLVNSALLVKSEEESLATVDLVSVNLYTGQTKFFKAGAATTFLYRGGHSGSVEAFSLPAGILRDVTFEQASIPLKTGDIIIMTSDGVTQGDDDWVQQELGKQKQWNPQQLAEHLARCARTRSENGKEDDITVLVGLLAEA